MWVPQITNLTGSKAVKVAIDLNSTPVSYAQVLSHWQNDAEFRSMFIRILADCPYSAFRWETPPITKSNADRPFECVILDSPGLASVPDAAAFAEHFKHTDKAVIEFANLSGDAILVVPRPLGSHGIYGHIGTFVRQAPAAQIHSLWQAVGSAMQRRLGAKPVWLSTAGAGVSWLHVRLDDRPKYYTFAPYRDAGNISAAKPI
jgi:hypothetical protein